MFKISLPLINRPILWYGFFFALGFLLAYILFARFLKHFLRGFGLENKVMTSLLEKLSLYITVGMIVGARLGDVLFYQNWSLILQNPWEIIKFWEGGLASHGAAIGILTALFFFSKRVHSLHPYLSWKKLLDLVVIPVALAGACIRIGNFFNQEIIGTPTTVSWAVIFGHPADHSLPVPRHPVQLYESIFYLLLFGSLWMVKSRFPHLEQQRGKISGLFFILLFSFRFLIEFFKSHQSALLSQQSLLDMGQLLSIPCVIFGLFLFFRKEKLFSSS